MESERISRSLWVGSRRDNNCITYTGSSWIDVNSTIRSSMSSSTTSNASGVDRLKPSASSRMAKGIFTTAEQRRSWWKILTSSHFYRWFSPPKLSNQFSLTRTRDNFFNSSVGRWSLRVQMSQVIPLMNESDWMISSRKKTGKKEMRTVESWGNYSDNTKGRRQSLCIYDSLRESKLNIWWGLKRGNRR